MPKTYIRILTVICGTALASTASPDASRFLHTIDTAAMQQEEIAAVTLPPFVWDQTDGQPILFILDQANQPVPYLLRRATTARSRTVRNRAPATMTQLREHPGNRIELEIELDAKAPAPTLLEVSTPLRNFERHISIAGITPDGTAIPLVEDGLIYDYTRFADVRSCEIALPENPYRTYRLLIHDTTDEHPVLQRSIQRSLTGNEEQGRTEQFTVTERPFRIDAVNLYAEREEKTDTMEREALMELKSWVAELDAKRQQTVIEIETFNTPLNGIVIETREANFSRQATVFIPRKEAGREQWHRIGQGQISRTSFRGALSETRKVTFPRTHTRRIRVLIDNHDNAPLPIENIQGAAPIWQALFIAQPGSTYRLLHGSNRGMAPRYDTASIERLLARGIKPSEAPLATAIENPDYQATAPQVVAYISPRTAFIAGIIIMTAVLAWGLFRAARGIPNQTAG
jgi:hypothetical protein